MNVQDAVLELKYPDGRGYNSAPPNFKEIDENTFMHRFDSYGCGTKQEFRQIWQGKGLKGKLEKEFQNSIMSIHLFWYIDGTGMGIYVDREYSDRFNYKYKGRYFSFCLCEHDYNSVSIGPCLTRNICKKCGYANEVDSSG